MLTKKKELYNRRRQRSEIDRILQKQRAFFAEGKTYEISFRKAALKRLEASILAHEKEVCQALTEDLGKSETEGYMCEVGLTLAEIRGLYRNVKAYSKTKRVPVSMANFPAKGYLVQEPYGITLVMSPWNYPFMLAMEPLAVEPLTGLPDRIRGEGVDLRVEPRLKGLWAEVVASTLEFSGTRLRNALD